MTDRLRPPSSGPAGRGPVHRQIASAPQTALLIPPADIHPEYGGLGVNLEYQGDQFIYGFQPPDAGANFDATNQDIDFEIQDVTINDTDINNLDQFIGQYGAQAHPNAGSWNPLGAAATYSQNTVQDNYLTSGNTALQFMASQSTATPSQVESSLWDASSIYSGTTDSSMICEICLKLYGSAKQKDRHQRTVHGDKYRCKCTYESGRRDNYTRHLEGCRKQHQAGRSFICLCGEQTNDFNSHWAHVKDCKRPPGRRPNSSRKVR
ncbi:hypothetical protein CKAH01_02246 [Colletotrichum kahawae]|uniref:C2H2-type domain-containing protein n=1 Tax=Colletotrichum kahawae TaxID=34407 RepID=A0AAE0CZT0_COLKA|nr:hypothetical protein CKAH01_02246 [Colletotrichum kahawae]